MLRIDSFPTNKIGDLEYCMGRIFPFGATIVGRGINFSIYSQRATACTLVLYRRGEQKPFVEIPFPEAFRIGNVFSMMVFDLNEEEIEYGYRFDGPFDEKAGHRFDKEKVLLDPYAESISGRLIWRGSDPDSLPPLRGRVIRTDYDWEGDKPLEIPLKDLIIYEMHLRSYTCHPSSKSRYPGTFAGLLEKIPYLKSLGVNCIELLPIFEFDEYENPRSYNGRRLVNYWGYSTVGFFAPKAGYAYSSPLGLEADELKNLVKHLHAEGIEVILDVVFNHTAEGGADGPCISFRGIDNKTYYLLDEEGRYLNYSGCGNTMNCNNAVVRDMILSCLRYWVASYHIDGFRFDLASILTRCEDGTPMIDPPLLESLAGDPVLGRTVLIAEAWDAGGLYQVGSFPSWNRWSEWNGRYRDCVRRFIRGDESAAPELLWRVMGSRDLYKERGSVASINFVTCHDGFTLYDLVSYNKKHNEMNGEENRDGSDCNDSWNCGEEGESTDEQVLSLRFRQMKNILTLLLTSRGVPMLLAGDEFANSQQGNNNAYCQDSEISYLNWEDLKRNAHLNDYVRKLIALRKRFPVLRSAGYSDEVNNTGYPEHSWHGERPWELDCSNPGLTIGSMFVQEADKGGPCEQAFIYVGINAHWEPHEMTLPIIPQGFRWKLYLCASEEAPSLDERTFTLKERSSVIWLGTSLAD